MRRTVAGLLLSVAALGLALVTGGGTAQAGTISCGTDALHETLPQARVLTCVEAEGDTRRVTSIIDNGSTLPVRVADFTALISYPNYGTTQCGPGIVPAHIRWTCTTPWVSTIPNPHSTGVGFTLLRFWDATGTYQTRSFSYRAP